MIKRMLLALTLLTPVPGAAQTLGEAIAQAGASNPQLAAARARQEAREETVEQARAGGRLVATTASSAGYDRIGGNTGIASANGSLPIWAGGRVRSAVRAATEDVAAGAEGLRDIEAAIIQSVAVVYGALLFNQQAVEVARVGIDRLDRQVAEARSRFELGQLTRTDVAQLEAQRASVAANLADAEGALATALAAYRAVVGVDAGVLSADVEPPSSLPSTLAEARVTADASNPLLRQQQRVAAAAIARIDQARAEGAPALNLEGAYGAGSRLVGRSLDTFTAVGSAGLTFRVPLITGGFVSSRLREARATARAERLDTDTAAREVRRSVDASWASLNAASTRLRAATEGLAAAELALNGVRAEYGFGLRSTIDILVADQSYRAAQLSVAAARSDVIVGQATLLRSVGALDFTSYRAE